MRRLKPLEVKAYREEFLKKQLGVCMLCGMPLFPGQAVADHDHSTGRMRYVIHRGCNCLLGKVENNFKRYALPCSLVEFLIGAYHYLNNPRLTDDYHPSYRTPEEKRLLRNKRARRKRKAKKSVATT